MLTKILAEPGMVLVLALVGSAPRESRRGRELPFGRRRAGDSGLGSTGIVIVLVVPKERPSPSSASSLVSYRRQEQG